MKKLTIAEKKRRGTFDRSKIRTPLTFKPLTEIPEPMTELDPGERGYFDLCAEVMISNGTLTSADVPGMERAAKMWGIYQKALGEVKKLGCYQTTKNGYTAKNGPFQVLCEAEKLLTSWERSQGLTIVSRSKLPPPTPPQKPNPFDEDFT